MTRDLSSESDFGGREDLMQQGFELLEAGDFDAALRVAERLKQMRHSSNFEIAALALQGLGRIEAAIEVLEEGVTKAPSVWRLWELLGNLRSDMGRYPEAHAAYERAMQCPDVAASIVHLNMAIALSREERFDEAENHLAKAEDDEVRVRVAAQRLHLLNRRGRPQEALSLGKQLIAEVLGDSDLTGRSLFFCEIGRASLAAGDDRRGTVDYAVRAHEVAPGSDDALWLLREAEHQISPVAMYYRVMVHGTLSTVGPDEAAGFYQTFDVVADSPEEAMQYIRRLAPLPERETLVIEEIEQMEHRPTEPKGIYRCTGRMHYREDEPQDSADDD